MTSKSANHPSLLDLELQRTGEASPEVAAHVGGCAECQALMERLGRLPETLFTPAPPPNGFDPVKEAAMFTFIRQRAAELRLRHRAPFWRVPAWLKVAAALALVGGIIALFRLHHSPTAPANSAGTLLAVDDLNRDGAVDILDALLLARRDQDARSTDVCLLANRIVAIPIEVQ